MRMSRYATLRGEPPTAWPDWVAPGTRRRLDALNRLVCCVVDGVLRGQPALSGETAVVVANSYGSVDATLRFVGSIAAFGDHAASPTAFTTSVHNSSAGVLGELLQLHGPSTTLSQGGTGGLSVLRWAQMMLGAGRAPAVLAVVGDRHVTWSRDIVTRLSDSPWPIGDGAAAMLLEEGQGPGREVRLGTHPATRCLDGGALVASDERVLAERACGQERIRAPDQLGAWWPNCLLSVLPWDRPEAVQLREIEDGHLMEAWLGPAVPA